MLEKKKRKSPKIFTGFFTLSKNKILKVKIALSSVSVEGAKLNLQLKFRIGILKKCIKTISNLGKNI
jgi:putative alpha-1,2-mannosidase